MKKDLRKVWEVVCSGFAFLGRLFLIIGVIGVVTIAFTAAILIIFDDAGYYVLMGLMGLALLALVLEDKLPATSKIDIYLTKVAKESGFLDWLLDPLNK